GRQGERAWRLAGLAARGLYIGARRLRLEAYGIHHWTRLQSVEAHPVGSRGARRQSKRTTDDGNHSIHSGIPTRAHTNARRGGKIRTLTHWCNHLDPVNLTALTILPPQFQFWPDNEAISPGNCLKWLITRSGA